MASYCLTEDVIVELPYLTIDETSKPSEAEVDEFCFEVTAEMDARFRAVGILVPITDEDALMVVKPIALNGVKARALRANQDGEFENAKIYEDLYQDSMKRIETRPSILGEQNNPEQPEGSSREDEDIKFTRSGSEW
jgi:hypothetical protein